MDPKRKGGSGSGFSVGAKKGIRKPGGSRRTTRNSTSRSRPTPRPSSRSSITSVSSLPDDGDEGKSDGDAVESLEATETFIDTQLRLQGLPPLMQKGVDLQGPVPLKTSDFDDMASVPLRVTPDLLLGRVHNGALTGPVWHVPPDRTNLVDIPSGKVLPINVVSTTAIVPRLVRSLGRGAFAGWTALEYVVLEEPPPEETSACTLHLFLVRLCQCLPEDSLRLIELNSQVVQHHDTVRADAFLGCCALKEVNIPHGTGRIAERAFHNFEHLTTVNMSYGITSIGIEAFAGCPKLAEITIPPTVEVIGFMPFARCTSLAKVILLCKRLRGGTSECSPFAGFKSLTSVTLGMRSISMMHLDRHPNLTSIQLLHGVLEIGEEAFSGCARMTSVSLPDGLRTIGAEAFRGCRAVTDVTLPASVSSIEALAFAQCKRIKSIVLPNGLRTIDRSTFECCTALREVVIPNSVTAIEHGAFFNCGLETLDLPSHLVSLSNSAFQDCRNLTRVVLPSTITVVPGSAFCNCVSLREVEFPCGLAEIQECAFKHCINLASIDFPQTLRLIGDRAFMGCESLESVVIPARLNSIGPSAFEACSQLCALSIPRGSGDRVLFGSLLEIGGGAFMSCPLTDVQLPKGSVLHPGRPCFSQDCSVTIGAKTDI